LASALLFLNLLIYYYLIILLTEHFVIKLLKGMIQEDFSTGSYLIEGLGAVWTRTNYDFDKGSKKYPQMFFFHFYDFFL
jgi:hypothetical protein